MSQPSPLLGPGDPPPFERLNDDARVPVLLICDHASRAIPAALDSLGLDDGVLDKHVAWDIGAASVARGLADRLGAMTVLAGYSRLVMDLNRQPGDPGSIPEVSDDIVIPGNQDLSEADAVARTEAVFRPYHDAVADALAHLWRATGTPPALFSVHTFTPSLGGEDRAWHVGVLWNRDPRLAEPVIHGLRARPEGLHVGDNEPYSGKLLAYSLDLHAGAAGLPHCAVEIRQDLVTEPADTDRWALMLADVLNEVLADDSLHRVEQY